VFRRDESEDATTEETTMTTTTRGSRPSAVGEPAAVRWRRRAISIPSMLGATLLAVVAAPIAVAALALADLARGRRRLPRARLYLVVLQYVLNDSVEILLAPLLWVAAGFGTRLDSPASQRRHARLQRWSIEVMARRAERLLGLCIEVEGAAELLPAPAIVLVRHISLADASLPGLLYDGTSGVDVRGVIMHELLSDPGFDLLYGRLGSVFVDRDSGEEARSAIGKLAESLDHRSVGVIFPEGRLFRPELRDHLLGRLCEKDPLRAQRLQGLRHVLPPRPGGTLAMLAGAPDADVVVVGHTGFESIPSFADLARSAPVDHRIRVRVHRVRRSEIPIDPAGQLEWLDQEWLGLDGWIDAELRARHGNGATVECAAVPAGFRVP
jgi:1-acyl-sn-glycerol-3-phosphate acyltransferase